MRNGLFEINKGGYMWEQHKFTSERGENNKYIPLFFFLSSKTLYGINYISSLMLVLMFIGDI